MAMLTASRISPVTVAQRPRPAMRPLRVVTVRANKSLDVQVQEALKTAEVECDQKGVNSKDCEVAWDQAEELLAAKSHKKVVDKDNSDPLEQFCKEAGNEDADECRIHEV